MTLLVETFMSDRKKSPATDAEVIGSTVKYFARLKAQPEKLR
jgi:hypothetical protein